MNIFKNCSLTFSFLLISFTFLIAQNEFEKGFIITQEGDSLFGEVRIIVNNSSNLISYRMSASTDPVKYTAGQMKGFGLSNGKSYETKKLFVDSEDRFVFMKLLIKGDKSLYQYVDKTAKVRYYFQESNEALRELKSEKVKVNNNRGGKAIVQKEYYKGELKYILKDCESISNQIENTQLNEQGLIRLFKSYYKCTNKENKIFEVKEAAVKRRPSFGFLVGPSFIKKHKLGYFIKPHVVWYLAKTNNQMALEFGVVLGTNRTEENTFILYQTHLPVFVNRYSEINKKSTISYKAGFEYSILQYKSASFTDNRYSTFSFAFGVGYQLKLSEKSALKINVEVRPFMNQLLRAGIGAHF